MVERQSSEVLSDRCIFFGLSFLEHFFCSNLNLVTFFIFLLIVGDVLEINVALLNEGYGWLPTFRPSQST